MGIFDKLFSKQTSLSAKETSSAELEQLFDDISIAYQLDNESKNIETYEKIIESLNQFTNDKIFNKYCIAHAEDEKIYISLSYNGIYLGLLWKNQNKSFRQQLIEHFEKKLLNTKYRKQKTEDFNKLLSSIALCDIKTTNEKRERLYLKDMPEIKTTMITKSTILDRISDFVVLDLETTGLRPSNDSIIEISLIRFENFSPVEMLTTLVNPNKPIPEEAQQINNISDQMVKESPEIGSLANAIKDFVGKQPIVGHNIAFDLKFLYCNGINLISIPNRKFDTLELSKKAYKKDLHNYKLSTVTEHNNIIYNNQHRSTTDALATGLLFVKLCQELGN